MKSTHDDFSQELPLIDAGSSDGFGNDYALEYDEDGSLALARALSPAPGGAGDRAADTPKKPLKTGALNGSWFLQLTPKGPHTLLRIRGPLRIEVGSPKFRVSGDIYVSKPAANGTAIEILKPITEKPLLFGKNWYPQLPTNEYSWYFRSLGVTYKGGKLVFKFERHLWNRTTQEFIGQENSGKDQGFMELECHEGNVLTHALLPQPTLRLTGVAHVGGEIYHAVATKTSPLYRGCAVEVDVMTNREFPLSATSATGALLSFANIYRTAGMDCVATVDQTDLPNDDEVSTIELQTALSTNRRPVSIPDAWRLWLVVASNQGGNFGLMFDDVEPFREGTAGFFDPTFDDDPIIAPEARNKKLGEVREAFLRTLVHEAGHAFNLFHPKHDVHTVSLGTTIMNQTGDVMGFATEENPYPHNVTFSFDDHNRSSLIHSPDPQVAPGWKRFGWGHGSLSNGIAEPVDAAGFLRDEPRPSDIEIVMNVPDVVFRGEFVAADFVVTNTGTQPRTITSAINLSQGDLRLLLKPPTEELHDVRDVILACGDRPFITLQPGAALRASAQIFFTNVGFTFRQTGRYFVSAELHLGDGTGAVARSNVAAVVVRAPANPQEEEIARLTLTPGVGRAFAFGDYGADREARYSLEVLAERFGDTDTGAAAALILANADSRDLRDLYSGKALRQTDRKAAQSRFDAVAAKGTKEDLGKLVRLAAAVAAPTEGDAPVLDLTASHLAKLKTKDAVAATAADDAPARPSRRTRRKESADAPAAAALEASSAQDLLTDIRRTFAAKNRVK